MVNCRRRENSEEHSQIPNNINHASFLAIADAGDRAFPVAAARVWNSLPHRVTSASSMFVVRSRLNTHPFTMSYPNTCVTMTMYSARAER